MKQLCPGIYATRAKSTMNDGAVEHAGKIGTGARRMRKYMRCGSVWSKIAAYMRM